MTFERGNEYEWKQNLPQIFFTFKKYITFV